jgi:hypothetical protein
MNVRKLLFLVLLPTAVVIFGSCKDDENEEPTLAFVFGNISISLEGANFYLIANNNCCNNHSTRTYVITDGVYSADPGWGWEFDDYTGETYLLIVNLLEPDGAEHGVGEYQMYPWFNEEPYTHERMSYVGLYTTENGNSIRYITGDDRDKSPVVVKGGLNIGDNMTISFEGLLLHQLNQVEQTYEESRLHFSGTVSDVQ